MEFEASVVIDGDFEIEITPEDVELQMEFRKAGLIIFPVGKKLVTTVVKQFMTKGMKPRLLT